MADAFGSTTVTFADDVARHEGRQDITRSGGIHARVLVVGSMAYISGNEAALVDYFGFPVAIARGVGTRWVSIPSSSSRYSITAADATLPSALNAIMPVGPLTETAPTKLDGEPVVGVRGRAPAAYGQPGSETLYLTRSSRPLPVLVTVNFQARGPAYPAGKATSRLNDWGERLSLAPPTNTIPVSKL